VLLISLSSLIQIPKFSERPMIVPHEVLLKPSKVKPIMVCCFHEMQKKI
jgi:hypothetical protein